MVLWVPVVAKLGQLLASCAEMASNGFPQRGAFKRHANASSHLYACYAAGRRKFCQRLLSNPWSLTRNSHWFSSGVILWRCSWDLSGGFNFKLTVIPIQPQSAWWMRTPWVWLATSAAVEWKGSMLCPVILYKFIPQYSFNTSLYYSQSTTATKLRSLVRLKPKNWSRWAAFNPHSLMASAADFSLR